MLDLIDEYQRLPRNKGFGCGDGNTKQKVLRITRGRERLTRRIVRRKIEFNETAIFRTPEFTDEICLADLTGTGDKKRLSGLA